MANKYVRCDSHCKYPAYDKEEVDALFTNVYKKGNFAVLEHTIPKETLEQDSNDEFSWRISTSVDASSIKLPDGFTPDNTMILSAMWKEGDGTTGNGLDDYWTTMNRSYLSSNEHNITPSGLDDVSINRFYVNGENRLWFNFQLRSNMTNAKPIYLKFLIMKVE